MVARPAETIDDFIRAYEIWVDDHPVGEIKIGEFLKIHLTPGAHRIRAGFAGADSAPVDFEVALDETVVFAIEPADGSFAQRRIEHWLKIRQIRSLSDGRSVSA